MVNAQDCFSGRDRFQCPVPQACCVDGACFDLTAEECEERGGQLLAMIVTIPLWSVSLLMLGLAAMMKRAPSGYR